ncbi:MAG TPA: antitoxin [Arachnia sp.]|nr:antitoxin [Arachnia sp.]HMT86485.1 antitoxin [Arachnia sp.]
MGLLDDIKKAAADNEATIESAIEKIGDVVDQKTGGKYADKVDQAQGLANDQLDKLTGQN